jgi:hypothetical protein
VETPENLGMNAVEAAVSLKGITHRADERLPLAIHILEPPAASNSTTRRTSWLE